MERLSASRVQAIGESLRLVDPVSASALVTHAPWLREVELVLREANIQLASPSLQQTATVIALRDRIDRLFDIVPRPLPINQVDGS